jgi:SAM-dependent methyltransferase
VTQTRELRCAAMASDAREQVGRSIAAYARYAESYDDSHGEIFNPIEQDRLRTALVAASRSVASGGRAALDYGCGSGNLTRHLLDLGLDVTAVDVSPHFAAMVHQRFGVPTMVLTNGDVHEVPNDTFDFIGLYSVLHHIPDYLGTIGALTAKLRPGGVLFLDHEYGEPHWNPTPELRAFRSEQAQASTGAWWDPEHKRWQHLVRAAASPNRHLYRYRRWRNPRYSHEGDIHVWPDDHIEFDRIAEVVTQSGGEIVEQRDYLLFKPGYRVAIWERHRDACSDMSCIIARRTH